ncbi:hypothetical protein BDZ45DRAFT_744659 [Acephala macrosclerotiorum]|nr:hypothetical protein BDZ45DRAFT_744659 [Acephala macrosclerotiorum]
MVASQTSKKNAISKATFLKDYQLVRLATLSSSLSIDYRLYQWHGVLASSNLLVRAGSTLLPSRKDRGTDIEAMPMLKNWWRLAMDRSWGLIRLSGETELREELRLSEKDNGHIGSYVARGVSETIAPAPELRELPSGSESELWFSRRVRTHVDQQLDKCIYLQELQSLGALNVKRVIRFQQQMLNGLQWQKLHAREFDSEDLLMICA